MAIPHSAAAAGAPPFRHGVAKWRSGLSLRARLTLLVAIGTAAVVALLSFLQVRLVERTFESQRVDSAQRTAQAVADNMQSLDETDVPGWLHDFIEAEPAVRAITIVSIENGEP